MHRIVGTIVPSDIGQNIYDFILAPPGTEADAAEKRLDASLAAVIGQPDLLLRAHHRDTSLFMQSVATPYRDKVKEKGINHRAKARLLFKKLATFCHDNIRSEKDWKQYAHVLTETDFRMGRTILIQAIGDGDKELYNMVSAELKMLRDRGTITPEKYAQQFNQYTRDNYSPVHYALHTGVVPLFKRVAQDVREALTCDGVLDKKTYQEQLTSVTQNAWNIFHTAVTYNDERGSPNYPMIAALMDEFVNTYGSVRGLELCDTLYDTDNSLGQRVMHNSRPGWILRLLKGFDHTDFRMAPVHVEPSKYPSREAHGLGNIIAVTAGNARHHEKSYDSIDGYIKTIIRQHPHALMEQSESGTTLFIDALRLPFEKGMPSSLETKTEKATRILQALIDTARTFVNAGTLEREEYAKCFTAKDKKSGTILHHTLQTGDEGIFNMVLQELQTLPTPQEYARMFIAPKMTNGYTPLHYAAASGNPKLYERLVAELKSLRDDGRLEKTYAQQFSARTTQQLIPLHHAIISGDIKIYDSMLAEMKSLSNSVPPAIGKEILTDFFSAAAEERLTPLQCAAISGNPQMLSRVAQDTLEIAGSGKLYDLLWQRRNKHTSTPIELASKTAKVEPVWDTMMQEMFTASFGDRAQESLRDWNAMFALRHLKNGDGTADWVKNLRSRSVHFQPDIPHRTQAAAFSR